MFGPGILKLAFALAPAVFAVLSLGTFAPARAAAPAAAAPAAGGQLSLEDALRAAEETSPLLRRARAERDAVAARDVGASVLLPSNPVIGGGGRPAARRPAVQRGEFSGT